MGRNDGSLLALVRSVAAALGPQPGPAPDGEPLRLRVRCSTSPDPAAPSMRHDVLIAPDWTVETPHDLEAERWAVAMGGHLSCLGLVDDAVPAVRAAVSLLSRRTLPSLVWDGRPPRWRPRRRLRGCCTRVRSTDVAPAAAHLRDPEHVAASTGADVRQVGEALRAVVRAHGGGADFVPPGGALAAAASVCARDRLDAVALWEAGLHPALVVAVHDTVGAAGRLPQRFYLGVLSARPDLAWVAETLRAAAHVDAADDDAADDAAGPHAAAGSIASPWLTMDRVEEPLATWLVWSATDADRLDPTLRARWLATGVSRPLVLELSAAGYSPDDVVALAAGWRRDVDGAARSLAAWVRAGARPNVDDLLTLERRGVPSFAAPSAAAVARLRSLAAGSAFGVDDTELALLVVAAGTVPHAAAALIADDAGWRASSWRPPSRRSGSAGIGGRRTGSHVRKGA